MPRVAHPTSHLTLFAARALMKIVWTPFHTIDAFALISDCSDVATSRATDKKRVGHSPTRRKYWEKTRLNRGAQLSTNCVTVPTLLPGPHYTCGPSICQPYLPHGAPHGRPRGPAWSRGHLPRVRALKATCAPHGPPVALPRGLSAASHPCGGPARHVSARRRTRSPRQHMQVSNSLFRDFSKENINKNQIKNQKKA